MLPPDTSGATRRDALAVDVIERQRRQHAIGRRPARAPRPRRGPRASMLACDSSAPFGVPVVPDVYISIAGIVAASAACRRERSARRAGNSSPSASTTRISNVGARCALRSPRSALASSGAIANTSRACRSARACSSSCASCASRLIGRHDVARRTSRRATRSRRCTPFAQHERHGRRPAATPCAVERRGERDAVRARSVAVARARALARARSGTPRRAARPHAGR